MFYSTFYSIAFRQKFALTEISKYSTVINNIGRFDYIALFALILSTAFSISLPLYFAVRILNHIFPMKKNQWIISAIICVLMGTVIIFTHQYLYSIETFFKQKMWLVFLLFSNILPIAISIILRSKKNEVHSR
ncbi:MAG: GerAB/ArcD/ProY family transporter [Clostridia bacterium]|nr:GerAB/ArcD/ProY family transporter [Clostridia bacterium]